jgi:hypothetical protein
MGKMHNGRSFVYQYYITLIFFIGGEVMGCGADKIQVYLHGDRAGQAGIRKENKEQERHTYQKRF